MSDQQGQPQGAGPAPVSPQPPVPPLPTELQVANASKDERTWAMVGHLAALAGLVFPVGNLIGPLVVWLIKREESKFVAFHAKQCMFFQIFAAIAAIILLIPMVTIPLTFLIYLGAMAYAIYGAVQVSGGKDFEYYWVGPWVRRSMM